jgi:hypothetical protein
MWIAGDDPAWDDPRYKAEQATLGANVAAHPVHVYYSGATRFSLEAMITVPEAIRGDGPPSVKISHYWLPDARPTRFELCSVGALDWDFAFAAKVGAADSWAEFARRGLVRIHDAEGDDGKPTLIEPARGRDKLITDQWLNEVSRADRQLLAALGSAVFSISKGEVAEAEGKA